MEQDTLRKMRLRRLELGQVHRLENMQVSSTGESAEGAPQTRGGPCEQSVMGGALSGRY